MPSPLHLLTPALAAAAVATAILAAPTAAADPNPTLPQSTDPGGNPTVGPTYEYNETRDNFFGGQIHLPGVTCQIPSRYGRKYLAGLVRAPHTRAFVTRGVGTITLPMRFRARPEVNLLTLTPATVAGRAG